MHIDQLMMDMVISTPTLDEELPIPWKCENGMISNIEKLAQEYIKAKKFKVREGDKGLRYLFHEL